MSNPTSNFGWQMPTNTDLVTDLPADFEVFGQAVDSSMADLKGGTSGQILSKNSNTDMDFVWISNQVGDITAVTAGTGITGGGTSGDVTVSFDVANYGGGQYAAGKNKIINGDFYINQRNFTSTTTDNTYGFDRWLMAATGGTSTYSAQTFTLGAAPVAGYEGKNFARLVSTGQSGASDRTTLQQKMESVRTFAGQTVTVSFWAKASTGTPNVSVEFVQNFDSGTGGSATVTGIGATKLAITSSWVRYSATVSIPSISGKTLGTGGSDSLILTLWTSAGTTFNSRTSSLGLQSVTIDFWGVQVEAGSNATPFQTATGTIQGELAACQRYYWRFDLQSVNNFGFGYAGATTNGIFVIPFPVALRTAATALEQSGTTTDYTVTNALANNATTAVPAFATGSKYNCTINCATTALTVGEGVRLRGATTNAYLAWSAEL